MKLIIAIIQPHKLDDVKTALTEAQIVRLTIMDCQGFAQQRGKTEVSEPEDIAATLRRKVQLQIAVKRRVCRTDHPSHRKRRKDREPWRNRRWKDLCTSNGRMRSNPHGRARTGSHLAWVKYYQATIKRLRWHS